MSYTASQAAKATGKSIPTITRAIKSGKISATPNGNGWIIDPAELYRVFSPAPSPSPYQGNVTPNLLQNETHKGDSALQLEVSMLREMLEREKTTVADLRSRLDSEAEERRRLVLLITDQRPSDPVPPPSKKGWWIWGRSRS